MLWLGEVITDKHNKGLEAELTLIQDKVFFYKDKLEASGSEWAKP